MLTKTTLACTLLLALTACGATWDTSNVDKNLGTQPPAAVPASQVQLTSAAFNPNTQVHLGDLKVTVNKTTAFHADPTVEQVEQKLRADAAKLGATSVVNTQISGVKISPLSWGTRTGTGIAVAPK